jgi:hypothetical protein
VVSYYRSSAHASPKLRMYFLQSDNVVHVVTSLLDIHVVYSAWNPKDNYDMSASVFVVQFNGFMSLTFSLMLSTDINITENTYPCQF